MRMEGDRMGDGIRLQGWIVGVGSMYRSLNDIYSTTEFER